MKSMLIPLHEVKLSSREFEILQLIAEGLSNPRIASQLHISPNTTKTHVRSLMNKLGADCRTHLVTIAFRNDLLQ